MTSKLALNGGTPVRTCPWLTYDQGNVMIDDSDVKAAERAVRSQLLFRYDKRPFAETEVGQFETSCADFFGTQFALATSSGTTALALALMGAGIGPGDLVACPAFTFPATPSAIKLVGARMQLVEVDDNLNFDLAHLQDKITPDLKAIVVVHMRGVASNIEALVDFAQRNNVILIEDAVPVFGATYNGKMLGTFGQVGAFSTQSDKALNTGEGGLVITDDRDIFERMCALAGTYEGRLGRHLSDDAGGPQLDERTLPILSWRMDEIRAAIGRNQLDKFSARREAALTNYELVTNAIDSIGGLNIRKSQANKDGIAGDSLIVRLPYLTADEVSLVAEALRAEGIAARSLGDPGQVNARCFWHWLFCFEGMTQAQIKKLAPRSVTYLVTAIDIPLSPLMTDEDRDDLFAALRKVLRVAVPLQTAA